MVLIVRGGPDYELRQASMAAYSTEPLSREEFDEWVKAGCKWYLSLFTFKAGMESPHSKGYTDYDLFMKQVELWLCWYEPDYNNCT